MSATGLPPATAAFYMLSFTSGTTDLPYGLTGCTLHLGLPTVGSMFALADGSGRATVTYALSDRPLLIGDIFSQWFWFDGTVNNFRAGRGIRHQVR